MKMPRPSEGAKERFSGLVPDDTTITLKPMFGNLAAFVNGNMFAGLFGEGLFVRLPDPEAEAVIKKGGKWFEPVAGHRMGGYVMVAPEWQQKPATVQPLIVRALTLTRAMPAKAKSAEPTRSQPRGSNGPAAKKAATGKATAKKTKR